MFRDENVTICAHIAFSYLMMMIIQIVYVYTYIPQPAKSWPPTICDVGDKKETKYQYVQINEKSINKMQLLQKSKFNKELGRKNAEFGVKY
jgi:hypothetical protein